MSRKLCCTRRHFLKRTALLGAAWSGLASLAAACTPAQPAPAQPTAAPGETTQPVSQPTTARAQTATLRHMFWADAQQGAIEQQVQLFNEANPGIEIDVQLVPWGQYWDKLWTSLAGGGAPETFWLNMGNFAALSAKGVLLNLQPYLDKDPALQADWDANFGPLKEAYSFGNEAHAWPRDYDTIAIALNLSLLEAEGLPYPPEDNEFRAWDWQMCRSYAEKLTKQEGGRTTQFGLLAAPWWQMGYFNWLLSNGATVLNADKTECVINEPAAIEALQDYVSYRLDGLSPGAEVLETQVFTDLFYTGRVAMAIIGNWSLAPFNENISDFEYDIVPIPYAPTGQSRCTIHGLANTIDKGVKDPDAALKWVSFLGTKEGSSVLGESGVVIPSREDAAELWFDPAFPPKHRHIYLDWTPRAGYWPDTASPTTDEWRKFIDDELLLVMEQGKDLEEAMDAAAQQATDILAGKGA